MDNSPNEENFKADIVIVGGGGAGLAAAISAKEAGANKVIVLEKTPEPGGNASLCHGIYGAGSPAQKRKGINVSPDELFLRRMEEAEWQIDPRIVRNFYNKSGDILQWLEDKGLVFDFIMTLAGAGGFSAAEEAPKVFHMFDEELNVDKAIGNRLVETLVKECQNLEVQILYDTAAKNILTDEKGQVNGILAETKNKVLNIAAGSVIIAAGGFGANQEMLKKYFPEVFDTPGEIFGNSLSQMTGDGILMATELGATSDRVGIAYIGPHHYPWSMSLNLLVRRPHVMLVNKNGERYAGSPLTGSNHALNRQPDKVCYALLDSDLLRDMIEKRENFSAGEESMGDNGAWLDDLENDLIRESTEGTAKIADTWDEIAEYIGAKPEVLKATVARYNSFCDQGYDEDFLKDKDLLLPLRTPPYYAVLGRQGSDGAIGGIKINHRMEVINKQGDSIGGLYAAGDNAGGILAIETSIPGQGLSFALYSGRLAGENAASYILEKS